MSHSKVRIWVHAIFGVKHRQNLIVKQHEIRIYKIIRNSLLDCKCYIEEINGTEDHVHALFLLSPNKSISEVMKQVKGFTSYEINKNKLLEERFSWQVGYGAFSISESHVQKVKNYILKQEEHHKRTTYEQEYQKFIEHYKLDN